MDTDTIYMTISNALDNCYLDDHAEHLIEELAEHIANHPQNSEFDHPSLLMPRKAKKGRAK